MIKRPDSREYKRADRVGDMIREVVAEIIYREIESPVLEGVFLTITAVKVTDNLKMAIVFVSVLQEGNIRESVIKELTRLSGVIRHEVGKQVRLKYIPALTFKFDPSLEYVNKIEKLLNEVCKKNDDPSADDTNS